MPDTIIGGSKKCKHYFNAETSSCTCGAFQGQYGLEPQIELYIEHTMLWISEAMRVLKDDGIFFLNMGDTYGGKCKYMVPAQIALDCMKVGWLLRNEIVWYKPNGIPDSIKDRFTRRWESVFMFTKSPSYHFDLDAVRVPYKPDSYRRFKDGYNKCGVPGEAMPDGRDHVPRTYNMSEHGANPGDVWKISAGRASGLEHFSVYPEQLIERLVRCSTRDQDTVLDPFVGSGTTALVAAKLGRKGVGIDLGYKDVQRERLGLLAEVKE